MSIKPSFRFTKSSQTHTIKTINKQCRKSLIATVICSAFSVLKSEL